MSSKLVTATNVFGKKFQVETDKLKWRPSVYGIVIEDDKILLSPQFQGRFDLPGGGVNLGEDLEAAVIREVKEETGIDVKVVKLLSVKSNLFAATHGDGEFYHTVLIYYLCKKIGGELSDEGLEDDEVDYVEFPQWVEFSKLDKIEFASTIDYRKIVTQALKEAT